MLPKFITRRGRVVVPASVAEVKRLEAQGLERLDEKKTGKDGK